MQLSSRPPFIPYIVRTFLSVPSPPGFCMFSHPTPYPPRTYSHMLPRYLIYVSLFYYNSSFLYGARFLKGRLARIQD